jgi:hypothetical protein
LALQIFVLGLNDGFRPEHEPASRDCQSWQGSAFSIRS